MWIHIPKECFPFARDTEGLNSPLEWQELPPDLSLTSKGKPILLRTLRRLWKKGSFIQRLSGIMFPPSMVALGMAWWRLSLRDSRVSRSLRQESDNTSKTNDGSGQTSRGFYGMYDPEQCSWRTSQGSLFEGWDQSLERFASSGSMRNGRLYEPTSLKSEHPTSAPVSSSLRLTPSTDAPTDALYWPTPDAGLYGGTNMGGAAGRVGAGRPALSKLAQLWPTPSARDHRSTCASEETHDRNARPLSEVVGLQAQAMKPDGDDGSKPVVLNPEFVETMMGLPTGWSAYGCSGTESVPSKRRMRSKRSGGGCASEALHGD